MSGPNKKGMSLEKKHNVTGWVFLIPATALICWMSFYPVSYTHLTLPTT